MLNTINSSNTFKNMTEHFTINALSSVNNMPSTPVPSIKVSDTENPKKKKLWNIITATMGSSILAAGALVFILNKGFSHTSYNRLNSVIDKLNDIIEKSALSKKSKNLVDKGSILLVKGVKNALDGLKATANFSAIKDSGFDMIARKFKFMQKPLDKLTDFFRNISTKAVDDAYNKVLLRIQEGLCPDINKFLKKVRTEKASELGNNVTIKGITKPLKEWLDELETRGTKIGSGFQKSFSKDARNIRALEREAKLNGLNTRVQDELWHNDGGIFNIRKNGHKFKTYITETLSQEGKSELKNGIITSKKELTNNIDNNFDTVKSSISEIRRNLQIEDKNASAILRKISSKMDAYRELGGALEDKERTTLVKEISDLFSQLGTQISSTPGYKEETKSFIAKQIEYLCGDILGKSRKGELEEAITIIHGLTKTGVMEAATERSLLKHSREITKDISKATTMEADELYDKFAEFKVGSVPLDVLSLLFPLGVATAAVSAAKSKDEKISKTLTTGIPLVGSLITMLIGTAKMFTASKNLIIGAVTGIALNEIGKLLDKTYKDYSEKRSFTKMALEAYKKNPLFYNQTQNVK